MLKMTPKLFPSLLFIVLGVFLLLFPNTGRTEPVVLDGLIEPYEIVNVGSSVRGIIDKILVERGDLVEEGQVLARLESDVEKATMELARVRSEMESAVREKEAVLEFSRRKEKRLVELHTKSVIPSEQMEEAVTNVQLAVIELESAKENLVLAKLELKQAQAVYERMSIRSPIMGVVMERFLSPGEFIEDQPLLKLAQVDKLNVEIFAPAELMGRFKVGMTAKVRVDTPRVRTLKAKVKIVDLVVDAASGTFGVRLEMPNPILDIPVGVKCKVTFP
jgi:RND family efflux transporter MFP subunit